ncbi:T9SS type A sorting domain-containing protein [Hymenobacter terrenus]|uniref:T9SS type A sorting domain-containing protein n=1 Tax=Hymenobacter terrenus TaxID=1629124 RepID=UPI000696261E|nr:T9SS type A sorting domain-containing protein [Hymenobacter terrenus]
MKNTVSFLFSKSWLLIWVLLLFNWLPAMAQPNNLVTYAGGTGQEKFLDVVRLSDGTCLVAGTAQDLNWVPATVPRTVLAGTAGIYNAGGTSRIGFILHLTANLSTILRVVSLPVGAAESIARLKTTNVPGQPTGTLFISGTTMESKSNNGGYFLARLDQNFVTGAPTALVWTYNVWASGYAYEFQPWDVGSDGRIIYITGQEHANDWVAAYALDGNTGKQTIVPNWRTHWLKDNKEYKGLAASAPGGGIANVAYSGIVFKKAGRCDLRSWNMTDYKAILPDGNGRTKQGRWPLDAFFGTPCDPAAPSTSGSGYTGYRTGAGVTYGASAVVIDRRSNDLYIGFNVQTRLPSGEPDYEPAVIALAPAGDLRWWSRLYHEVSATGTPVNSTPDQYIDGLALDYSKPTPAQGDLVVLARCHGNNVENFWSGNRIAATPGAQGFQNNFTGNKGDIHISWLGKLGLADGTLHNSTFVAEYEDLMNGTGGPSSDPNLDGWPSPNSGWPNVNTTRLKAMRVGPDGSVAIIGKGRRTITTAGAYQKMVRAGTGPGTGVGSWTRFVRVYEPNLSTVRYSSVLAGTWSASTSGDNTTLEGLLPEADRVLVVGLHQESATPGVAAGNPVPTTAVPAWGSAAPSGQSALLASLRTTATAIPAPLPVTLTRFEGRRIDAATTELTWATASELNNAGFTIEKGSDGLEFSPLAEVAGQGTSQTAHAYRFVDQTAKTAAYYRLAQRDHDGQLTYSKVIYVTATGAGQMGQLVLAPNPAHGKVQLLVLGTEPSGTVQVLDPLGRVRLSQPVMAETTLAVESLPVGVYLVQVQTAAGRLVQRLVIE